MSDIVTIENLSKSYPLGKGEFEQVLFDINLSLPVGKFVAIYGPSGCGKSTMMNIIGGLDRDYQGTISYKGEDYRKFSNKAMASFRLDRIGFVFQHFNLISHMSALDNVLVPLYLVNIPQSQRIKRAQDCLDQLGMLSHADKNVTQLSGGQKQRVAIARALANDPDLILADEPTGALDTDNQAIVIQLLKDLVEKGKTVVVVTHNPEVSVSCDIRIDMKDGRIINEK